MDKRNFLSGLVEQLGTMVSFWLFLRMEKEDNNNNRYCFRVLTLSATIIGELHIASYLSPAATCTGYLRNAFY